MPRYGGLLFSTGGDFKMWGAQYWWHNSSCYYAALISSGCTELAEAFVKHMKRTGSRRVKKAASRTAMGQQGTLDPGDHMVQRTGRDPGGIADGIRGTVHLQTGLERADGSIPKFRRRT